MGAHPSLDPAYGSIPDETGGMPGSGYKSNDSRLLMHSTGHPTSSSSSFLHSTAGSLCTDRFSHVSRRQPQHTTKLDPRHALAQWSPGMITTSKAGQLVRMYLASP